MEGGKIKCLCIVFRLAEDCKFVKKNAVLGILMHKQQVVSCCQAHSNYGPSKMPLRLAL